MIILPFFLVHSEISSRLIINLRLEEVSKLYRMINLTNKKKPVFLCVKGVYLPAMIVDKRNLPVKSFEPY